MHLFASAPIQLTIFSGSVRKANTVAGGAAIWVSRRTTKDSVIRVSLDFGCADGSARTSPRKNNP